MGILATLVRRGVPGGPARSGTDEAGRYDVPPRFEAVAEALVADLDPGAACAEVGRELARDGAAVGEALSGLEATYACVRRGEPAYTAVRALCEAWGEESLAYLHQLSCENPLTGLASLAHAQARLSEVFRGAEQGGSPPRESHALVVVDVPSLARPSTWSDPFEATLRLVRVAETVRVVFPGEETVAQAGTGRLVVLARRGELLARRAGLLRDLVDDQERETGRARVWVEGLPTTTEAAAVLLDEIARS